MSPSVYALAADAAVTDTRYSNPGRHGPAECTNESNWYELPHADILMCSSGRRVT